MLKVQSSRMLLSAAAVLVFLHSSCAFAAQSIGSVKELTGAVMVTHAGEKSAAALKQGDAIAENDAIATTAHSHLKIQFVDKTELLMADKGSLVIDQYVYNPANAKDNKAKFSILGAAFYYVGGLLDKSPSPDVSINLDLGTIGIRGTKIMRGMKNGECWVYLEEGKITVSNNGGGVTLAPGQGTIMKAKATAPQAPQAWTAAQIGWMKDELFSPQK